MLQQIMALVISQLASGGVMRYFINPPAVQKLQDFSINYIRLLQVYLMALWDSVLAAVGVEDAWDFANLTPGSADFKEPEVNSLLRFQVS